MLNRLIISIDWINVLKRNSMILAS